MKLSCGALMMDNVRLDILGKEMLSTVAYSLQSKTPYQPSSCLTRSGSPRSLYSTPSKEDCYVVQMSLKEEGIGVIDRLAKRMLDI